MSWKLGFLGLCLFFLLGLSRLTFFTRCIIQDGVVIVKSSEKHIRFNGVLITESPNGISDLDLVRFYFFPEEFQEDSILIVPMSDFDMQGNAEKGEYCQIHYGYIDATDFQYATHEDSTVLFGNGEIELRNLPDDIYDDLLSGRYICIAINCAKELGMGRHACLPSTGNPPAQSYTFLVLILVTLAVFLKFGRKLIARFK